MKQQPGLHPKGLKLRMNSRTVIAAILLKAKGGCTGPGRILASAVSLSWKLPFKGLDHLANFVANVEWILP